MDQKRHRRVDAFMLALLLVLALAVVAAGETAILPVTATCAADATPAPEATNTLSAVDAQTMRQPLAEAELKLGADGFAVEGEYVFIDEETGEYRYLSPTLDVHITRHVDTRPSVVWHEAQIRSREDTLFHMYPFDEPNWMTKIGHQTEIAQKNHLVFAINSDFAHLRISWKATEGLLIRSGQVISTRTRTKKATKYPNLDNLALLADGSMLAMGRNNLTIDDYVAMGAYDLLAFGPVLVHDGVLNTSGFKRYGWENAPRTAVGMVEPGHYVAIMVEGRYNGSRGWSVPVLAEHMAAIGATEALNLDGGQSATMMFMGEKINRVGKSKSGNAKPRKSAEVLGIGVSMLVGLPDEE